MTDAVAEAVIGIYRRQAVAWTTARGSTLVEGAWLDRFCELLPSGAELLDIGCGSGLPIARELSRRGHRVTGIDSAPEMAALFERNVPDQQAVVADMRTLSLGPRFAGLLAWDSFFHLSQAAQRRMFAIFRDHAIPAAPLMFTSGPHDGAAIGELEGEPLFHASLDPSEYRHLLDTHGFDVVRHVVEDPECERRTVWLAQSRGGPASAGSAREQ